MRGTTLLAIFVGTLFGCGSEPPPLAASLRGDDCVILVLDSLHAEHLSCYGAETLTSPNIDGLAARGVRFARVWSQTSWTLPSTVSLFTGLYQEAHGVIGKEARLPDASYTLAEAFDDAGYHTRAFVQNPFAGANYGLGQGFDTFEETIRPTAEEIVASVVEHLAEPSEAPRFVYVHLRKPHSPFDPAEPHRELFAGDDYAGPVTGASEDIELHNHGKRRLAWGDVRRLRDLYHGNIHHIDAVVGDLLDGIDLESTLVVVLSDHGEAFAQHGMLGHNWRSFEEYVRIPWVMAHPALPTGAVLDAPVMTIDVYPTLAELFGLAVDPEVGQGASQVPLLEAARAETPPPPRPRAVFTSSRIREDPEKTRQIAVSDGRYKLMWTLPFDSLALFDLEADPAERRDVIDEHPEVAARLRHWLDEWLATSTARALTAEQADAMDESTREALRALGYLGGDDEDGGH